MSDCGRPVLRWHGGKWRLAPWIISHFPAHRVYVEPFGGAASVLLRKERSYAEIYNDLDGEVVTLFRVLRDSEMSAQLVAQIELTPFARDEFDLSYESSADPVEAARRLVVRSFMGFGSAGVLGTTTGFRASSNRSGTTPAHDFAHLPQSLAMAAMRLRGIVIERADATAVLRRHDCADALHYVDPPYMPETRSQKKGPKGLYHSYKHEMTVDQHSTLLGVLRSLSGAVVLSGYGCELYDECLRDWRRVERAALADGARRRTEVLWLNDKAAGTQLSLIAA